MTQRDEVECKGAHLKWELPGGKAELNETPQQTVEREFLEETGIQVKVGNLLPFVQTSDWEYEWGIQHTFIFGFACEFIKEHKKVKDHHVRKMSWIDINKVKNLKTLPAAKELINLCK